MGLMPLPKLVKYGKAVCTVESHKADTNTPKLAIPPRE